MRLLFPLLAAILLAAVVAGGCSRDEPKTPEDEIRAVIAELEDAGEREDISVFRKRVAKDYAGQEARNKVEILGFLQFQFIRGGSIHLMTRIHSIDLDGDTNAQAVVFVAAAGTRSGAQDWVPDIHGDFFRVDAELVKDPSEGWQLRSAEWRPATTDDIE